MDELDIEKIKKDIIESMEWSEDEIEEEEVENLCLCWFCNLFYNI